MPVCSSVGRLSFVPCQPSKKPPIVLRVPHHTLTYEHINSRPALLPPGSRRLGRGRRSSTKEGSAGAARRQAARSAYKAGRRQALGLSSASEGEGRPADHPEEEEEEEEQPEQHRDGQQEEEEEGDDIIMSQTGHATRAEVREGGRGKGRMRDQKNSALPLLALLCF